MSTLSASAAGRAAPGDAWELYADPRRWPTWAPQIRRVDTAAARITAGLRGRVEGPLRIAATFVIDDVDETARTWAWTVRLGPIRLRLRHEVAVHPAGARARLWITGPLPVVAAYLPVAAIAQRRLVAAGR